MPFAARASFRAIATLLAIALAGCTPGQTPARVPTRPPTSGNPAPLSGLGGAVLFDASVSGQVLTPDGLPATGVEVVATVISNNGGTSRFRRIQAETGQRGRTDANGRFQLAAPTGAALAVEALGDGGLKAISPAWRQGSGELRLQLAPTGSLAGQVGVPEQPAVKDLTGVEVYIPGTSYAARTDAAGAFVLADVPAGSFVLVASRDGLGRANAGVRVASGQRTTVPALALRRDVPLLTAVVPPVGAPGLEVEVRGEGFGASTGTPLQVTLGGAVLTEVRRSDDQTLRVVLPANAGSGDLVVALGGSASPPLRYAVARKLVPLAGRDALLRNERLGLTALALDAVGQALGDVPARWEASGGTLEAGMVQAPATGSVTLAASFGALDAKAVLPVRPALGLTAPFYTEAANPTGLARDPRDGTLYLLDAGHEGEPARLLALAANGQTTPTALDGIANPREVAIGPDGTPYVLAADGAVWAAGPTPTRVLTPEQARAAVPSGQAGPPGSPAGPGPGAEALVGHGLGADGQGRLAFTILPFLALRFTPGQPPEAVPLGPPMAPGQAQAYPVLATRGDTLAALLPRPNLAPALLLPADASPPAPLTLAEDPGSLGGLALDDVGRLYLAATSRNALLELGKDGSVRTLTGNLEAPKAVVVTPDGQTAWVLEAGRVQRVTLLRAPED